MAIGMAQQKGTNVYVYDENNRQLWTRWGELQGYTSSTVTIKNGNQLYMYDERGTQKGSRAC
ncbi:hypothetical protein IJ541_07350 [bacterium]|nr:hypothetical protein [bacterium]